MSDMMASEESSGKGNSLEELHEMFVSLFSADLATLNNPKPPAATSNLNKAQGGG
eukprot:c22927_g1_i1 orf=112-276(+)